MKRKISIIFVLLLIIGQAVMAQKANYNKLSGLLISKLNHYESKSMHTRASLQDKQDELLMPLIKADSEEALTRQGVRVLDHIGNIYFAIVPLSRMAALSNDEGVRRIELNESPKLQMDQTAGTTGVTNIYQGLNLPQAYTGKGVLVGICDSGFDYTHPMFQNADGTTRIRWAWDIYTGRGATEGYLGIGSLYDTPEKLAKACGSIDSLKNHGTHVAGIATGSPVLDGKYRGIAYESDIAMFMSGTSSNNPYDENRTLGDLMIADIKQASSNNIEVDKYYQWDASRTGCLLGIKHFFDYATEQNMPAVMNCSWGSSQNFYFDTSLEEEVFNEMAKVPGHIIVASAGNNSDTDYYRAMKANETLNESLNYLGENAKDESPYSLFITTKGDFEITLSATLTNGNAKAVFDSRDTNADGQYCYWEDNEGKTHYFGFYKDEVSVPYHKQALPDGRVAYKFDIIMPIREYYPDGTSARSARMTVTCNEDYVMNGAIDHIGFSKGFSTSLADHTVTAPAAYDCVLAVGATSHRNQLVNRNGKAIQSGNLYSDNNIVSWSGTGPTFDGRTKPDVCAPGYNIISSNNSNLKQSMATSERNQSDIIEQWQMGNRTYEMVAMSGTSMASPVVAGIVALWLQAKSNLTLAEVKEAIAATSKHLDPTLPYPNNVYGYGEINAYAGLLKLLNIETSIPNLPRQQAKVSLHGRILNIDGYNDVQVTIYNLNGQQMLNTRATDGTVMLNSLPSGVYAVKIGQQGSTLIRL